MTTAAATQGQWAVVRSWIAPNPPPAMTEATLPADSADAIEPADPSEPTLPALPTLSKEPTEPTEPMLNALFVDAMLANEPLDHSESLELLIRVTSW